MRLYARVLGGVAGGILAFNFLAWSVDAAEALALATDIDQGGAEIFGARATSFGAYTLNSAATLNGNAVLGITQNEMTACCHGVAIIAAISNGENGDDGSPDMVNGMPNMDVQNTTPANSVFTAIGNPSGRLENGNVIRISAWFRSDPANPITVEPQVAPILKVEYWKEGLSGTQDSNAVQAFPNFGDRVFDQDQQGYALTIPDPPAYVDIDNSGAVAHDAGFPPQASAENGRLFGLSTSEWTLASVVHTVNSNDWLGIGAAGYGANDVTKIEAIKGVVFLGEFGTTTDTSPDGPDGGTLLVDNMLFEVFKDAASVTPLDNPNPALSEMTGVPGDYNGNNIVDAADYVVWRNGGPLLNEGASAGVVDVEDYNFWRAQFGNGTTGVGAVTAVPEPASCGLAMLAFIAGCHIARRRGIGKSA